MFKKLVEVSEFVKRQKPNSGKTYTTMSFDELALYAEKKLKKKSFKKGYRDGVVIINVEKKFLKFFKCPFVKIDKNTKLKAEIAKRRPNEEHYIRVKALNGKELKAGKVELILYRNDVLKESNENTSSSEWELISFHAIPSGVKNMPMGPVTMMRNQLQLVGGTKGIYSSEEWAESIYFWQHYAIKE
tara:strand:+ start:1839 stop:2399 length:561 start_codon:yes stop_codon:yes gene_type:complete